MNSNKYASEFIGTFLLVLAVVGSGIMGENLASGNMAVALLANSIATGAALYVLIHVFGPTSGAHFNPAVSLFFFFKRALSAKQATCYALAQITGGVLAVFVTHFIFDLNAFQFSQKARDGSPLFISEVIATLGLLLTIIGFSNRARESTPVGVALYITGAYWFTSSTSFANPAVTIARIFTDTFSGIAPHSAPLFILAQLLAVGIMLLLIKARPAFFS